MSRITQCVTYSGRVTPALPLTKMVQVLAALAIVVVFFIAHLNLRFSINRLQTETIRLQTRHDEVKAEIGRLSAQNEAMKQPDRLHKYARYELGMVPISITEKETLTIPTDINAKYALARAARRQAPVSPEDRLLQEREIWLSAMGQRMGLSSKAQAKETK